MRKLIFFTGIVIVFILLGSCEDCCWFGCIEGNGVIVSEQRIVGSFNRIESNGDFEVYVYQGDENSVEIETDKNLMDYIVTNVSRNTLVIATKHSKCLQSSHPIIITVVTPYLAGLELNGSGNIWCDTVEADDFKIDMDGSGEIDCEYVEASNLKADVDGSGNIKVNGVFDETEVYVEGSGEIFLTGESNNANYQISGSGRIIAKDMSTVSCYVNISGSGSVSSYVIESLNVRISGSGTVYYYGNPDVTTHITGSGKVIRKN
jgi:hypothetical protein